MFRRLVIGLFSDVCAWVGYSIYLQGNAETMQWWNFLSSLCVAVLVVVWGILRVSLNLSFVLLLTPCIDVMICVPMFAGQMWATREV